MQIVLPCARPEPRGGRRVHDLKGTATHRTTGSRAGPRRRPPPREARGPAGRAPSRPSGPARRPSARGADRSATACAMPPGAARPRAGVTGPREPAARDDAAAGAGERLHETVVGVGGEEHAVAAACPPHPLDRAAGGAKRGELVARGGSLLVAMLVGQAAHAVLEAPCRRASGRMLQPEARLLDRVRVAVEMLAAPARRVARADHASQASPVVDGQARPADAQPKAGARGCGGGLGLGARAQRPGRDRVGRARADVTRSAAPARPGSA